MHRSARRWDFVDRGEALDDTVFAEGGHDGEEAGSDGLAGESDTGSVDESAGFDVLLGGEGAEDFLGAGFSECRSGGVASGQFLEERRKSRIAEEFCNRGGIVFEVVTEVGSEGAGEIFETAGARFEEIDGGQDFRLRARGHEFGGFPLGFDEWEKLFRIVGSDVFGIEPGELVVVKNGVRFGNAVEGEKLDEVVRGEDFPVSMRGSG